MRLNGPSKASAADAPSLLTMTSMASIDGTVPLLAANGMLATASGSVAVGLTVIAGIGAWIAAWQRYPKIRGKQWLSLLPVALASAGITLLAAAFGLVAGEHLVILPKAAGIVLLLIAAQMAGLKVPGLRTAKLHASPVVLVLAAAALLEVFYWIP